MKLSDHPRMPTMAAAMTPFPYSADVADPIAVVERLMAEHAIRHVPIQEDGVVVGLISERDLHHRVHATLPATDKARIPARALMLGDPYAVEITTPLDEVLEAMLERHIGCVVVLRHGKLAGIFSAMDACRLLGEILRDRFAEGPDAA